MAHLSVLRAPPAARRWSARVRFGGRLAGWIAGAPASVRTKLLVSFLLIAALLVLVAALGLDVLRQGNAIDADNDLEERAAGLAERTKLETASLVAANRRAYTSSRNLFVAVSAASVLLALGLGVVLSWSLIRPIQETETRLAEISAGDFS